MNNEYDNSIKQLQLRYHGVEYDNSVRQLQLRYHGVA